MGFLTMLLLFAPVAQFARPTQMPSQRGPNVLLVLLDDVGVFDLNSYGATDPAVTPVIDGLAAAGTRFERCWSMPVCSPTRATLMTGNYPFRHGIGKPIEAGDTQALPILDNVYLPALMRNAGYRTALIGKWHLSLNADPLSAPNTMGYEHFSGIWNNIVGSQTYSSWPWVKNGVAMGMRQQYITSAQVDDALDWIHRVEGEATPWFCVLSLTAAHTPLHVPPAALLPSPIPPNPTSREKFLAMIQAIDTELARLLTSPDINLRETLVVILGDNGTPANVKSAQLKVPTKGYPTEGGVRVPLIMAGAGTPMNAVDSTHRTVAELPSAFLAIAGTEFGPGYGLDSPHPGCDPPQWQYSESFAPVGPPPYDYHRRAVAGIVGASLWKLLDLNGEWHMYNLDVDPTERFDEYGDPGYAGIQAELEAALGTFQ